MGVVRQMGRRWRALVADQLQTNRILLQELLAQEGYICVLVTDGEEALDALDDGAFDLVVLEERLPVQDALTVLKTAAMVRAMSGSDKPMPPAIVTVGDAATARELLRTASRPAFVTMIKPLTKPGMQRALQALRTQAA